MSYALTDGFTKWTIHSNQGPSKPHLYYTRNFALAALNQDKHRWKSESMLNECRSCESFKDPSCSLSLSIEDSNTLPLPNSKLLTQNEQCFTYPLLHKWQRNLVFH